MEGKEAAEIRGLVLSQDASNRTVCYSTQLGAAICVQLPSDVQISRGQWLIFTEFEYEANVYIVEKGAINIENDENVLLQNDEILIRTKAVCSGDDSHSTFTKNTAFAGGYGYVVAGKPEIENGIVYNVNLAVHSMDGPLYFKIHSVENSLNTDNEQLLLKLTEAENEKNRRATPDFLTAEDTGSGKISDNASDQYSQPQNNQDNADDFDDWENGGAEIDNTNNHRSSTMPNSLKTNLEMNAIVLHIDGNEYTIFETYLLKMLKIKISNGESNIAKLGTLKFIADDSNDGYVVMKTFIGYTPPLDPPVMETEIVFSSDRHHNSFNKGVAVSSDFGFVKIPEAVEKSQLEEMVIYKTNVSLYQYQDQFMPAFVASGPLEKLNPQPPSTHTQEIIEKIKILENRAHFSKNQNGLGASSMPSSQNGKKLRGKKPDREKIGGSHRCLFLESKDFGRFHGTAFTPFGIAKLTCAATYMDDGRQLVEGDWFNARIERVENTCFIVKICDIVGGCQDLSEIRWISKGIPSYRGILYLANPIPIDNIRYYTHTFLGLVRTDEKIYGSSNGSPVEVDFQFTTNAVVIGQKICSWNALPVSRGNPPNSGMNSKSDNSYGSKNNTCYKTYEKNHASPSKTIPATKSEANYSDHRKSEFEEINPSDNWKQGVGSSVKLNRTHSVESSQNWESSRNSDNRYNEDNPQPYMERPPTQYSSYTSSDDLREGYGFVTKMNSDDIWVVYLENNASTAARFNWRVVPGPQVKSGIPFLCLYRVLDDPDFDYDIVKVIEVCESSKNDVRVINKEVSCLVPFDLCDLDSNVIDSMDYGYLPFLKCERFGTVVLNDMVIDPRGQNVPAKDIVKRYRRDSRAKAMAGWCRFVKDFYPKSNFMENYKGIEMVEVYVWRVEEIVGEVSQYQHRQRTIQRENLGEDYQKIERDDFIEREKRIARERDRLNNQGRSDPGSHSSISGSQYSRAESSMNDYHTPHGSTYNRGASSSMSFHTANGHNSRYQEGAYHQPPTHQNYSGTYRSTPVNPLYDDKDARIAELEKKVSHAYRQMETLCSAIDPFLGHGEYRKKLKECSHEYTDHLVTTHDLCRNMVREYGRNKDRNISN